MPEIAEFREVQERVHRALERVVAQWFDSPAHVIGHDAVVECRRALRRAEKMGLVIGQREYSLALVTLELLCRELAQAKDSERFRHMMRVTNSVLIFLGRRDA
ncbi:hypothetical protein Acid345_3379 [Candidatus Koribacter versatilis Ellin345]|uniref:Uncharacterized protein n=1 Tax=Koribacter versatilis (strain Ellin345) TaxID=204669 RepID=Q1IL70_KORVE|nr:hypothetical protein [Candidatus Koribacter versatilis]ABF42380.1 hypothetical protein Acid345_3379 [Candidatus Koribacter versatilis Ellin345]